MTSQTVDTLILIESIATAAHRAVLAGEPEQAQHITRYAVAVLAVPERTARAWKNGDWEFAEHIASSDAVEAVRQLSRK